MNLLDGKRPTHAAILLFGRNPQRFLPSAELKCLHLHGTEVRKPIPSYQVFKKTIFDQVDQGLDFVLSKLARTVASRDEGPAAQVEYDIPRAAVAEAIVNAAVHRDYTSNAAVQVYVFSDRVEVWNPGELPYSLTPELLREQHASIPRNPLLAEALYLAHYIEKAGTGTLDMIALCREAGLPEPDFEQRGDQFVVTLWRDWLTEALLAALVVNERQKAGPSSPEDRRPVDQRRVSAGDGQHQEDRDTGPREPDGPRCPPADRYDGPRNLLCPCPERGQKGDKGDIRPISG